MILDIEGAELSALDSLNWPAGTAPLVPIDVVLIEADINTRAIYDWFTARDFELVAQIALDPGPWILSSSAPPRLTSSKLESKVPERPSQVWACTPVRLPSRACLRGKCAPATPSTISRSHRMPIQRFITPPNRSYGRRSRREVYNVIGPGTHINFSSES